MKTKHSTITLYSHWASALINNDYSSTDLLQEDIDQIKELKARMSNCLFYDVDVESFFGYPEFPSTGLKGDVSIYHYEVTFK